MALHEMTRENEKINYVVEKFRKQAKSDYEDIIAAVNLAYENNQTYTEGLNDRFEKSYIMCKNMDPAAEDVISMLLYRDALNNKASLHMFKNTFRDSRYERYHKWMQEACAHAPHNPEMTREDRISYYIMMRVCEKMFNSLLRLMNRRGVPDTICISQAYGLANKAHYWVTRKSGEPYLVHPIRVAGILAEAGVESQIIAAALLHDVVEDTDFTLKDIASQCGIKISKYVDAVTSLHRQYAESHNREEYSLDKTELDERSFEKLVSAIHFDRRMVFALYIKAADRIHNLSTMDAISSEKRHDKNDETELEYLPLFERFGLNYFISQIEDLMWRTTDIPRYEKMKAKYLDMVQRNYDAVEEMHHLLSINLGEDFNRRCQSLLDVSGYDTEIIERLYTPLEVYHYIQDAIGPDITEKNVDKKVVPLCDFDIVLDPRDSRSSLDNFATIFVKMFIDRIADTGRTITDYGMDKANRFILKIEDRYRNVFRCCFSLRDDYIAQRFGSTIGIQQFETQEEEELREDRQINVKLRNGKNILLPKGASVIDAAFAIHEEIGFAAKSAQINGQPASIFNILQEGDQVVVEADTYREDGVTKHFVRHVRISWLNSVVTKSARKKIIKYLSDKYEGDDSRFESSAKVDDKIIYTSSQKYRGQVVEAVARLSANHKQVAT